jgi:endonuclease/exonuclease/phosphatase family metal-dependent hydrolase
MRLRVATYNIHSCVGNDRGYDPRRIADVILETGADVVGLQEVAAKPELAGVPDQFAYLAEATGMTAIAGPNVILHESRFGNVLLTRWPALGVRRVDLSIAPYEPRGAVVADLAIHGTRLRVITTHLGLRVWERARQHATLGRLMAARGDAPAVIMGDFNSWWPDLSALKHLGPRFGWSRSPASFPAHLPFLALDRIWTVPDTFIGRVRAHKTPLARQASDHLPVVADLALPDPAPSGVENTEVPSQNEATVIAPSPSRRTIEA